MISVLNYKDFRRGSIMGFFDLRYHGLTIKGCRLMTGASGFWMALPQKEGTDKEGNTAYFDQMFLSRPEMDHVRRLVVAELEAQGHIKHSKADRPKPAAAQNQPPLPGQPPRFVHPDTGEDYSEYVTTEADDIPF